MIPLHLFLTAFLLFSSMCDFTMAWYAQRRRKLPEATAFAALMAAIGCYCFGYAFELSCNTLESMLFWSRIQYVGIVMIAPLWIIIALNYSGRGHWLSKPVKGALFIVPFITLILRTFPDFSVLIYRLSWITTSTPFPMLSFIPGPWYWVNVGYTNLSLLIGTLFIGFKPRHTSPVYRHQDLIMLLGSLFPWLAFIIYLAGLNPWKIDIVPIALSLTGPFYAWGILSFRLFDLAPVARETLFDNMSEPVLVFDQQERFVDCNRAAAFFELKRNVGLPLNQALEHLPGLADIVVCPDENGNNPLWQDSRDGRFWQVSVTRINQGEDTDRGRLVVLRNVTGLKRVEEALRHSEEQYRFVTENISDAIWQLDNEMRFVFVSGPQGLNKNFHGYSREDLIGASLFSILTPEGIEEVKRKYAQSLDTTARGETNAPSRYELQIRCKKGDHIWVEVDVTPYRDGSGATVGYVGVTRDISEQRKAEDAILKLSTIVEQSPVSILITDHRGIVEYVNHWLCVQTGYTADEIIGRSIRMLRGKGQPPEFYASMWRTLQEGSIWRGEIQSRKKNGDLLWESASISPIRNKRNEITHFAAIKEDITEKKLLMEQLQRMAHHDALTGLPNRSLFFDRLSQALARATRDSRHVGLLYLDLNGFKEINDTHGHEAGDLALKIVAERLASCLRESDTVARMGGDEFTLILSTLSQRRDAGRVAGHILDVLCQPLGLSDGHSAQLGASIGIAVFPDDAYDIKKLINYADDAMYMAKRSGKNCYCYCVRKS